MTKEQILKKAIEKAGYLNKGMPGDNCKFKDYSKYDWQCLLDFGYYELIFSHDFAKAFWVSPEDDENIVAWYCEKDCKQYEGLEPEKFGHWHNGWQYHLQQMVLEEDPIKYLSKFI